MGRYRSHRCSADAGDVKNPFENAVGGANGQRDGGAFERRVSAHRLDRRPPRRHLVSFASADLCIFSRRANSFTDLVHRHFSVRRSPASSSGEVEASDWPKLANADGSWNKDA